LVKDYEVLVIDSLIKELKVDYNGSKLFQADRESFADLAVVTIAVEPDAWAQLLG
jgi:hypothetical protein